jgi:hypothetical protein
VAGAKPESANPHGVLVQIFCLIVHKANVYRESDGDFDAQKRETQQARSSSARMGDYP